MCDRLLRYGRVAGVLLAAFVLGGASAEVAVRTKAAVDEETRARELGAAGELISLQLTTPEGRVIAQPRLVTAAGKPARLLLHAPGSPDAILMSFRVETARQPGGLISVRYELSLPDRALRTEGRLRLFPGVRQAIPLPDGELVATWLAVPFPSAEFDDFLEAERARRRAAES
jgi:hypothetical protein